MKQSVREPKRIIPKRFAGRQLVARRHAADDAPGDGARDLDDRDAGALPLEMTTQRSFTRPASG